MRAGAHRLPSELCVLPVRIVKTALVWKSVRKCRPEMSTRFPACSRSRF